MQTVYVIGDSTVEDGHAPFFGRGGQLAQCLPDTVHVCNHAIGGRSSKSFLEEGRFSPVQEALAPGDLLLIAFGHNDEKDDSGRHTDPETTFPEMLSRYVDSAKQAGATPVLVTSICRCYFTGDGSLMYTHGEYPRAVRMLAARQDIALIDLKQMTRALLCSLGPEASRLLFVHTEPGEYPDLPNGWHDQTHLSQHGARTVAELAAGALGKLNLF